MTSDAVPVITKPTLTKSLALKYALENESVNDRKSLSFR